MGEKTHRSYPCQIIIVMKIRKIVETADLDQVSICLQTLEASANQEQGAHMSMEPDILGRRSGAISGAIAGGRDLEQPLHRQPARTPVSRSVVSSSPVSSTTEPVLAPASAPTAILQRDDEDDHLQVSSVPSASAPLTLTGQQFAPWWDDVKQACDPGLCISFAADIHPELARLFRSLVLWFACRLFSISDSGQMLKS